MQNENQQNETVTIAVEVGSSENKFKPIRFLNEQDIENWQQFSIKVITTSKKGKNSYTLRLYFAEEIYQDFFITEQQFSVIKNYFRTPSTYSQNFIKKTRGRLRKGLGKTYGEVFTAIDLVVVPKAVFFEFKFLRPEVQYNVLKLPNLRWEEVNSSINEEDINYDVV